MRDKGTWGQEKITRRDLAVESLSPCPLVPLSLHDAPCYSDAVSGRSPDAAWCAADPHFTEDDPALEIFHRWLEDFLRFGPSTLILLGDLFSAWVALPGGISRAQNGVLDHLREVSRSGRQTIFLVGNRDYFVESLPASPFSFAGERWDMRLEGRMRVRFEHGDQINTSDLNYLRWRILSRTAAVAWIARALPGALQHSLAQRLERAMAPTNRGYKTYFPEAELVRWAEGLRADGVTAAALGHFHEDREEIVKGVRLRFVPQFREEGLFLAVGADGSFDLRGMAVAGLGQGDKGTKG